MNTLITLVTEHWLQVIIGGSWFTLMLVLPFLLIKNRNTKALSDLSPMILGLLTGFVKTAETKYSSKLYITQTAINIVLLCATLGFGWMIVSVVMTLNLVVLQPFYKVLLKVNAKAPLVLAFNKI